MKDERLEELEREEGIHYLLENPTDEGIQALVEALQDNDAGVRWSAGAALAQLGERALIPLLEALTKSTNDIPAARRGQACAPLQRSAKVRSETSDLMRALKGPGADVTSMEAAANC